MSAFITKCPRCGDTYMAGVVGTWSFPAHDCPLRQRDLSNLKFGPREYTPKQHAQIDAIVAQRKPLPEQALPIDED